MDSISSTLFKSKLLSFPRRDVRTCEQQSMSLTKIHAVLQSEGWKFHLLNNNHRQTHKTPMTWIVCLASFTLSMPRRCLYGTGQGNSKMYGHRKSFTASELHASYLCVRWFKLRFPTVQDIACFQTGKYLVQGCKLWD